MPPRRPRLLGGVHARQHAVGEDVFVILHDPVGAQSVRLEPSAWRVLEVADGTRDLEGIALAASRVGPRPTEEALRAFVEGLDRLGLLADGPPDIAADLEAEGRRPAGFVADRPIAPLPGLRWSCDGSGGCCSWFSTIMMTPFDVHRALAVSPVSPVPGVPVSRLLLPLRGSAPHPIRTPTLRDGACCFLDGAGGCSLHARGGIAAKPRACAAFPRRWVDDGEVVRATVRTECACVFRDDPIHGQALEPSLRRAVDVPDIESITMLPTHLQWGHDTTIERGRLKDWVAEHLACSWPEDLAAWCWDLAAAIDDPGRGRAVRVGRVAAEAAARLRSEESWRASDDQGQLGLGWIARAVELAGGDDPSAWPLPGPVGRAAEALVVRAAWWGYAEAGERAWSESLRHQATTIWLARAMRACGPPSDRGAFAEPLAVVGALIRGRGLSWTASET